MNFIPGLVKSPYDGRDWQFAKLVSAVPLPRKFACKTAPLPIRNQGSRGTCAGEGAAGVIEDLNYKQYGKAERVSSLYIYGKAKEIDGYPGEGTDLRSVAKVLTSNGACLESDFPFTLDWTVITSTAEQDIKARPYRAQSYAKVNNLNEMKQSIVATGNSLEFGMLLTESFFEQDANGTINPVPGGRLLGGHAMRFITYDDDLQIAYAAGSWGKDAKGTVNGIHHIPYALFDTMVADNLGIPSFMDAYSYVDMAYINLPQNVTISDRNIQLRLNGQFIDLDIPAFIVEGLNRAYFPIRALEKLGYRVNWDGALSLIDLYK